MDDQETKLRCLELAAKMNLPPDDILKAAKDFYRFIRLTEPQTNPTQGGRTKNNGP